MTNFRNLALVALMSFAFVACKKTEEAKESKADDKDEKSEKKSKKTDDDEDEKKPKKGKVKDCPDRFSGLPDYDKADELSCTCDADHAGGALWGSGIYTSDSNPCAAAIHAGVIKADKGGTVTMKPAKGCSSYVGVKKNAVTSHGWGSFASSFYFPDAGDGKCAKSDTCPSTFKSLPDRDDDTEVTCTCAANASGAVWGSHPYTQDSSLCAAAVHAGAITKEDGGSITAKASPGCSKYTGSKQNGVTTSNWGPYDTSFHFPSKGDGVCKEAKVVADAKWKVGDAVDANWNGAWYQATVVALAPGKYRVHYAGYAASWDEWVAGSRLRARTATSLKGSGK